MAHYDRWRKYGDPKGGGCLRGEPLHHLNTVVMAYDEDECLTWPYARSAAGYGQVTLDGQKTYVHREVCERTHGPAPTSRHEAAHTCGHGHLGCVAKSHLRWKSPEENQRDRVLHGTSNRGERQGRSKLTTSDVRKIRNLTTAFGQKEISEMFGVSDGAIGKIVRGETWGWLDNYSERMENNNA